MVLPPEIIRTIDELTRTDLQALRDRYFDWLLYSTYLVIFGIVLEGPEVFHETKEVIGRFSGKTKLKPPWIVWLALVGWIFVVLGVAGEGIFEAFVSRADGLVQTFNNVVLIDAERESARAEERAGDAKTSADIASEAARKATDSARHTAILARDARQEADSFEKDIVSAKTQAATAESHLAEALRRVVEQELEIEKLKKPRTISAQYRDIMAEDLKRFAGTEFDAYVGTDGESSDLLHTILGFLSRAGWKQLPTRTPITASDFVPSVGVSLGAGVHITMDKSKESEFLQPAKRLAGLLDSIGVATIIGYNTDNSANPKVLHIIVGKKPNT